MSVDFTGLHDVVSEKIELFITTAEGTPNHTSFQIFYMKRGTVKITRTSLRNKPW
jgi:hypothetical protein